MLFWVYIPVSFGAIDTHAWSYRDAAPDLETAIAVNILTQEGAIQGYADGTFRAESLVNRAEFLKIAMTLLPESTDHYARSCFPDVPFGAWFEVFICRAKMLGFVEGNRLFQPARPVQYEEALKILTNVFAISLQDTEGEWYVPYIRVAEEREIHLPSAFPGHPLTRGEVTRLTAAFLAFSSSSHKMTSSSTSSFTSSLPAVTSSSTSSVRMDELPDTDIHSQFLLLGRTSSILGSVKIFHDDEPFTVTNVSVDLTQEVGSIEALLLYDEDRQYLGRANLNTSTGTNRRYSLPMSHGTLNIPKRIEKSMYVRAMIKAKDNGGMGGQHVQIDTFIIEGDGMWTNETVTKSSSETFLSFQTARARITAIENAGDSESVFPLGPGQLLGEFRFKGEESDTLAEAAISDVEFSVSMTNDSTLTNVYLQGENTNHTHDCLLSLTTLLCSSIPSIHGTLDSGGERRIRIYGDVSTDGSISTPALQLSINSPGTITSTGSITWTDGISNFGWVQMDAPVVRGTVWK